MNATSKNKQSSKNAFNKKNSKSTVQSEARPKTKKSKGKVKNGHHEQILSTQGPAALLLANSGTTDYNSKELVINITDYFDPVFTSDEPIQQYWVDVNDIAPGLTSVSRDDGRGRAIVERVKVFVLPRASNAAIASSSFVFEGAVQTSIQKAAEPTDPEKSGDIALAGVLATVVKPTFNTQWIKVADWNLRKIFGTSLNEPVYHLTNISDHTLIQSLFCFGLFDTDKGEVFTDPIQFRVEITASLQLAAKQTVRRSLKASNSWYSAAGATPTEKFALVHMKSIRDMY